IPTLVVSSQGQTSCAATFEALRCGAVDVVAKPATPQALRDLRLTLAEKIRGAATAHPRPATDLPANPSSVQKDAVTANQRMARVEGPAYSSRRTLVERPPSRRDMGGAVLSPATGSTSFSGALIAIGASTGGTVAIQEILTRLPADMPPIVITQHIPPGFTSAFAERL